MLRKYEHWFLGSTEGDNPLDVKRKRILLYILTALSILLSLEWLIVRIINIQTDFPIALTAAGMLSLLVFYKIVKSREITTFLLCLFTFVVLYMNTFVSGGIFSMDLIFIYAVAMLAFLLGGKRVGLILGAICIFANVYSFYYSNQNLEATLLQRENFDTTYYFLCGVMNVLVIGTVSYTFANLNDNFGKQLLATNQELYSNTKELEEAKEKILESNKELEQYAYVTSHDLKQPLKTISSFSRLLEMDLKRKGINGESLEYLKFISTGTQNMEKLISDLLIYAQLNSNNKAILQRVNIDNLIGKVLNSLQDQIASNDVSINIENVQIDDLPVMPTYTFQLFQNLISNAIKYRSKERKLSINIAANERKNDWLFSIGDNGLGIEKAHQSEIFEPFKRVHQTEDEYQGSGIGLATCSKIIKKHKGKIWVDSEAGIGSVFYFTIPKEIKKREIKAHKAKKKVKHSVAV